MSVFPIAVIPVLIGPLQVLIAILPALLLSLLGLIVSLLRPATMWALLKLLWRQKLVLAVMAAVGVGSVWLVRSVVPSDGSTGARVEGADWPMFRGGLMRAGTNDGSEPPTSGGINWSYDADVKTFFASPAVVGNRVYVTSADKGPLRDRGAVYCIDAETGGVDWESRPSGYLATFSSPSIAGKYLVVGEGLHVTKTARVICMDVTQRGKILWTYQTSSHVESTPCIDLEKKRVYVGAGDDGYYCFHLDPAGEKQVIWHAPPDLFPDAESSPAVHDGRVFAGLGMGGNAIVCLDADTGQQIWRVKTPYPVFGHPTVVDGSVVVGMGNGNFMMTAEQVRIAELDKLRKQGASETELEAAAKKLGPAGEVWCVDEQTGEVRWKFPVARVVLGAVAAHNDKLFFGSRDGHLYCLSRDGKLIGTWNARAPLLTSPAVSDGHVYVVTESGMLYGVRVADMGPVWEARLGFVGPFVSSPTVARGHVYVGSQDDGLLCLGVPGGPGSEVRWSGYAGGPGVGGHVDGQPLPERGKLAWYFPMADAGGEGPGLQVAAPPACLSGSLYVPVAGSRRGLLCLRETVSDNKAAGEEVWFAGSSNDVVLSPAATTQSVFFVDGRPGDAGRRLRCLVASDGREQWALPVADRAPGELVLTDTAVLVADTPNGLSAVATSGDVLWRADCGMVLGMPAIRDAFVAVATRKPAGLAVLDRFSGVTLWRIPLAREPATAPVVRRNIIFLGTDNGVDARRLADGGQVWEAATGRPAAALVLAKQCLAYATATGEVVVLNCEDGQVQHTVADALPGIPPMVADEAIVYTAAKGLRVFSIDGEEPQSWMNSAWLGNPTCPPVLADSRIYIATDKKGLVCLKSK